MLRQAAASGFESDLDFWRAGKEMRVAGVWRQGLSASLGPRSSPENSNPAGLPGLETINCPFQREFSVAVCGAFGQPGLGKGAPAWGWPMGAHHPLARCPALGNCWGNRRETMPSSLHPPLPGGATQCAARHVDPACDHPFRPHP